VKCIFQAVYVIPCPEKDSGPEERAIPSGILGHFYHQLREIPLFSVPGRICCLATSPSSLEIVSCLTATEKKHLPVMK
jgi:hypothetical protein